jgi:hypothetical protein
MSARVEATLDHRDTSEHFIAEHAFLFTTTSRSFSSHLVVVAVEALPLWPCDSYIFTKTVMRITARLFVGVAVGCEEG